MNLENNNSNNEPDFNKNSTIGDNSSTSSPKIVISSDKNVNNRNVKKQHVNKLIKNNSICSRLRKKKVLKKENRKRTELTAKKSNHSLQINQKFIKFRKVAQSSKNICTHNSKFTNGIKMALLKTKIITDQSLPCTFFSSSKKTPNKTFRTEPCIKTGFNSCVQLNCSVYRMDDIKTYNDFVVFVNAFKLRKKVFTICGNFHSLRQVLKERGWIEKVSTLHHVEKKIGSNIRQLTNYELFEQIQNTVNGNLYFKVLVYRLLCGYQTNFYWSYGREHYIVLYDKSKNPLVNDYPKTNGIICGSKADLCKILSESHWFCIEGYSEIYYPRTYNFACDEDVIPFIDNFRLTACISLLKWILGKTEEPNSQIMQATAKIPIAIFNFAVVQCNNYVKEKNHRDIDENLSIPSESDWNIFLENFYKIVHESNHFKYTNKITKEEMVNQSQKLVNKIELFWPNVGIEGHMNLWLLKPVHGSQGHGIIVCKTLKYILDTIKNCKKPYVIQKYIERPLLIYNTKFDIRQYFLLTHRPCLQLWMYKDSYLKFSSQPYQLNKLHLAIHLTNNCVQRHYKMNTGNNILPPYKMWHCETFKQYLLNTGDSNAWTTIYNGMKQAMITIIMICEDKIIPKINSFKLLGADFIIGEDLKSYLLEINSKPDLSSSTPVTAKLCPHVLEDTIKVLVDYAEDSNKSTGNFELIYEDNTSSVKKSVNLVVDGINYFKKHKKKLKKHKTKQKHTNNLSKNEEKLKNQNIATIEQIKNEINKMLEKYEMANIKIHQCLSLMHENNEEHTNSRNENAKNEIPIVPLSNRNCNQNDICNIDNDLKYTLQKLLSQLKMKIADKSNKINSSIKNPTQERTVENFKDVINDILNNNLHVTKQGVQQKLDAILF